MSHVRRRRSAAELRGKVSQTAGDAKRLLEQRLEVHTFSALEVRSSPSSRRALSIASAAESVFGRLLSSSFIELDSLQPLAALASRPAGS